MIGEITPETIIKSNTFIIWRGGTPKDFELKVDYRITSGGNSGINYRSVVVPDTVTPDEPFAMRGYQCDIDGQNRYTGNNYEEKGALVPRGARPGHARHRRAQPGHPLAPRRQHRNSRPRIRTADWNAVTISSPAATSLMHTINGRLMSVVIDDDPAASARWKVDRRSGPRRRPDENRIPQLAHSHDVTPATLSDMRIYALFLLAVSASAAVPTFRHPRSDRALTPW